MIYEAIFLIIKVISWINQYKIKYAIFHTSNPHHIDTIIIEVACSVAKVPMFSLYSNSIDRRLLPIVHEHNLSDRKLFGKKISKNDSSKEIDLFIQNKLGGHLPRNNDIIELKKNKSLIYSLVYLIFLKHLYNLKRQLINLYKKKEDYFLSNFRDHSCPDMIRMLLQQRKAISFFNSKCLNEVEINKLRSTIKRKIILIAAHYQPEATSFPEGWDFSNHIALVLEIRKKGYDGPILYKEHPGILRYFDNIVGPSKVGMYRSVEYYNQLISLGCIFIPMNYKLQLSHEDDWYLPVTITGTIALERALFGLQTIVAGYPWFLHTPNIIKLKNFSCEMLLNENNISNHDHKSGYNYIENILSFKTITNVLGIGTGKKNYTKKEKEIFLDEYKLFLKTIQFD